ncbi:unnamed protein product [Camellia sinensis]
MGIHSPVLIFFTHIPGNLDASNSLKRLASRSSWTIRSCLLVKGWKGTSWSFPRGKKNKDEEDHACAVREVLEGTGFDVSKFLNKDDDIEIIFGQQRVRLYIIAGVKDDTAFAPLTKKEISEIAWQRHDEIQPANEDVISRGTTGLKLYMVAPFLLETTKFLYGCAVNSYILNVYWLIDSVAAGYALPRDKSLKAWILAHKPPVAPKSDLPLKVSDKINLDIQRVVGYRQWCNKLWNAVRFSMSKLGDNYTPPTNVVPDIMPFNCQWILSVLNKAISKTVTSLDSYEFSDAATVVYSWWQFQLCDVFIEAVKPYFASDAQAFASERSYAQDTLSCWTNEKVEYEMDMIESAVKSLRSLRALMPAKERHESYVKTLNSCVCSKLVLVTLLWLLECIFRAGLEQEIESLKKKLTACTREKLNLQEELSQVLPVQQ